MNPHKDKIIHWERFMNYDGFSPETLSAGLVSSSSITNEQPFDENPYNLKAYNRT